MYQAPLIAGQGGQQQEVGPSIGRPVETAGIGSALSADRAFGFNIAGAMVGGLAIGLIESLGGQYIAVRWTDVIIFSILILVLVLRPTGLMGLSVPQKS